MNYKLYVEVPLAVCRVHSFGETVIGVVSALVKKNDLGTVIGNESDTSEIVLKTTHVPLAESIRKGPYSDTITYQEW